RRLPALPGHHEDALPGPRRSLDRRSPVARSAMVRAGGGEGPRAGVWALVSPRWRSRRHLRPRRAVRAVSPAVPPATAGLVSRGGGAGGARGEGAAVLKGTGSTRVRFPSGPTAFQGLWDVLVDAAASAG